MGRSLTHRNRKGDCGHEPGDRWAGAEELAPFGQGWGFPGRCSGKDKGKTVSGSALKGLECRVDEEESKGLQGLQRKENRSQAVPSREGALRQRLRS